MSHPAGPHHVTGQTLGLRSAGGQNKGADTKCGTICIKLVGVGYSGTREWDKRQHYLEWLYKTGFLKAKSVFWKQRKLLVKR
jgi:hypothetical protein